MRKILYNGKFYIEQENFAQALLIENGYIKSIGTNEEILTIKDDNTELIDLEGKTVVPGFNDSHIHLYSLGTSLKSVILYGVNSIEDTINRGKKFLEENNVPEGKLIFGRGWNQDYFDDENRILTRYDLDKISTTHPIIFNRACGHLCVANSIALQLAGITKDTKQVEGGLFEVDKNQEPTGIFRENAMSLINTLIEEPTIEEMMDILDTSMEYANSKGITSVQTNDVMDGNTKYMLEVYDRLARSNKLTLRVNHQCCFTTNDGFDNFINSGVKFKDGNSMNKIGPLKLFVDGSLGAKTALLRNDYNDDKGNKGIQCLTEEQLDRFIQTANSNNYQVIIHAIGDGAIQLALDGYHKVINNGDNVNRHGIVHCQITDKELLERFKQDDILAFVQPIFLHYDMHIVESRVGKELANTSYAFNTMDELNIHVSYGTDSPVEDINVMECIHCAVNRQDLILQPQDGYNPKERVSIYQAIDNYTIGSAYASFEENVKGRIKEGYYADLAVLDKDIFTILTDEIKDVLVDMTVLNGEIVYKR